MALWKSRATHVEEHFRRDANLTAFFSKTIPVAVTSDLEKDFKLSCSEVIHTSRVDIRYMIALLCGLSSRTAISLLLASAVSDKLQAVSGQRNKKKRRWAAHTRRRSLTASRLPPADVIPGKHHDPAGSRTDAP